MHHKHSASAVSRAAVSRATVFLNGRIRLAIAVAVVMCWTIFPAPSPAQDATDIYLASIIVTEDGLGLEDVRNLTAREAYDNQPAFSADGSVLYYTRETRSGESSQTDIWRIELQGDAKHSEPGPVFETVESEYSPTLIPGENALSVIRVEGDGSQKLWRMPLDGKKPSRILDRVQPVGYHAWCDDELVLFVLAEPHELQRVRADQSTNLGRVVAKDIGRALKKIPAQDAFSFVHKSVDGKDGWWIQKLDVETDQITPLIRAFDGREDFTWSPGGKLWMADGAKVFRWCPACGEGWWPVADLTEHGFKTITRMAISPDGSRLAFVAEHTAAERNAAEHSVSEQTAAEASSAEP